MLMKRERISKEGIAWDFATPKTAGIALQDLNGRVPDYGWWLNKVCHETNYVIVGHGIVYLENKKFSVGPRDSFTIEPRTKHYIVAKKLRLLTITKPNWYAEQCEPIKE